MPDRFPLSRFFSQRNIQYSTTKPDTGMHEYGVLGVPLPKVTLQPKNRKTKIYIYMYAVCTPTNVEKTIP